jgi:hypothetical protein
MRAAQNQIVAATPRTFEKKSSREFPEAVDTRASGTGSFDFMLSSQAKKAFRSG